jgi:ornithine carbamoyltransferase
MATPHVAGLAALILSKNPSFNQEELWTIIRSTTDDVIDGKNSVVWDQAENRLHAQKGIMALLL